MQLRAWSIGLTVCLKSGGAISPQFISLKNALSGAPVSSRSQNAFCDTAIPSTAETEADEALPLICGSQPECRCSGSCYPSVSSSVVAKSM